jgi:hypothetical protein
VPISDLSDKELDRFESNYRRAKKTAGGKYSLPEILLEKKRRKPSPFGVRDVAAKIVELAAASPDGLVTYGEIWSAFRPNVAWQGNNSLRIVSSSLARVIQYCVAHRLPILNVLVVRTNNRRLSDKAIENIYRDCTELGVDVGSDPKAFVDNELKRSRGVVRDQLPDAE